MTLVLWNGFKYPVSIDASGAISGILYQISIDAQVSRATVTSTVLNGPPLASHDGVTVSIDSGNRIVLFGGLTVGGSLSSTLYCIVGFEWIARYQTAIPARKSHSMVYDGRYIWVLGGDNGQTVFNDAYSIEVRGSSDLEQWKFSREIDMQSMRSRHASVIVKSSGIDYLVTMSGSLDMSDTSLLSYGEYFALNAPQQTQNQTQSGLDIGIIVTITIISVLITAAVIFYYIQRRNLQKLEEYSIRNQTRSSKEVTKKDDRKQTTSTDALVRVATKNSDETPPRKDKPRSEAQIPGRNKELPGIDSLTKPKLSKAKTELENSAYKPLNTAQISSLTPVTNSKTNYVNRPLSVTNPEITSNINTTNAAPIASSNNHYQPQPPAILPSLPPITLPAPLHITKHKETSLEAAAAASEHTTVGTAELIEPQVRFPTRGRPNERTVRQQSKEITLSSLMQSVSRTETVVDHRIVFALPAYLLIQNLDEILLSEELGDGASGSIWKGYLVNHEFISRNYGRKEVAVKVIKDIGTGILEAFRQEVTIIHALSPHDNIINLVGYHESLTNNPVIVMGLADTNLHTLIHKKTRNNLFEYRLETTDILLILCGIADGMACLHQHGVIHNDLKSLNILININKQSSSFSSSSSSSTFRRASTIIRSGYTPLICDFGFASIEVPEISNKYHNHSSTQNTEVERILNNVAPLSGRSESMWTGLSPRYASPEMLEFYHDQQKPSNIEKPMYTRAKSDMWAVGVIIWEMMEREEPYFDMSDEEVRNLVMGRKAEFSFTMSGGGIPERMLQRWCRSATQFIPRTRISSYELLDETIAFISKHYSR